MTDLQLAELMAARLCHDLVGPIGAVRRCDSGGGDADRPLFRQATRRLQWFRVAFGSASGLPASAMFGETRRLAQGLFDEGRVTLDWPAPDAATENAATREAAKFTLNLTLFALECLPRGGSVQVRVEPAASSLRLTVTAIGTSARIPEDTQPALRENVKLAELTPKSVPGYLAMRLVTAAGSKLNVRAAGDDRVEFAADLPRNS